MPIWQRLLITLAIMLLASYLVGLLWHWLFNSDIPSYLSGAVGGLSAVPSRRGSSCGGSVQSSRAVCESVLLRGRFAGESRHRHPQATGASASAARALMPWRRHCGRLRVAVML